MEQTLGWRRFDVEGKLWSELSTAPTDDANRWLSIALQGALPEYESSVVTKNGTPLLLHFELSLIGGGSQQGLLMTAVRADPAPGVDIAGMHGRDFEYEVALHGQKIGALLQICVDGKSVPLTGAEPCHRMLYHRSAPCDDCPLLRSPAEPWPRLRVRHRRMTNAGKADEFFDVRSARLVADGVARVAVRALSDATLRRIHNAKLTRIVEASGLTEREAEILGLLLLGRTIDDIATVLGISPRTVKYHQANLLQKTGAESRIDLMRLMI